MNKEKSSKTEEKEIKKIKDMLPFDPLKLLGLRPKKIDERYKKYASLNRRIIAASIDSVIASFTLEPFTVWFMRKFYHMQDIAPSTIAKALENDNTAFSELFKLLVESGKIQEFSIEILLYLLANAICWKLWSATPGKLLLGIRIVDVKTDKPISDRQIILRLLGYIPACGFFFLGILWIGFNKRRQGWHDLIAGTAVIVANKASKNVIEPDQEEYVSKSVEVSAAAS